MLSEFRFSLLLFGLAQAIRIQARRFPGFAARLKEKNFTAQIRTRDGGIGRWYAFRDGRLATRRGLHPAPDMTITVANAAHGALVEVTVVGYAGASGAIGAFECVTGVSYNVAVARTPGVSR